MVLSNCLYLNRLTLSQNVTQVFEEKSCMFIKYLKGQIWMMSWFNSVYISIKSYDDEIQESHRRVTCQPLCHKRNIECFIFVWTFCFLTDFLRTHLPLPLAMWSNCSEHFRRRAALGKVWGRRPRGAWWLTWSGLAARGYEASLCMCGDVFNQESVCRNGEIKLWGILRNNLWNIIVTKVYLLWLRSSLAAGIILLSFTLILRCRQKDICIQ